MLGLFAIGAMDSLDDVAPLIGATSEHRPDAAAAAVYARLAPIFAAIPRQLEAQYRAITAFQRDTG